MNSFPQAEMIKICRSAYKNNVAKVTLQIAEANVLQIKQDIRVTFTDKLGVIGEKMKSYCANILQLGIIFLSGGTLGLFTGASLISLVEAIYWIYMVIRLTDPLPGLTNRNICL